MWIVIFETEGGEAPEHVGPFVNPANADRFAAKVDGVVWLLDPAEDYA